MFSWKVFLKIMRIILGKMFLINNNHIIPITGKVSNAPRMLPGQYFQQQIWSEARTWQRKRSLHNELIFLPLDDELWQ